MDSGLYDILGYTTVAGVVVCFSFSLFYVICFAIDSYQTVKETQTLLQLMSISFSLGMGPIPWVIMSEVNRSQNFIVISYWL